MEIKLLAVADEASACLERHLLKPPAERERYDLAVSCGDLEPGYLDYITTNAGCPLYYVNGNHHFIRRDRRDPLRLTDDEPAPGFDLHGRVDRHGPLLLCGFEGAPGQDRSPGHIAENTMARIVARVERRLAALQSWRRLTGRRPVPVVAVSHTPPAGIHDEGTGFHRGYICFRGFIERIRPRLWLHGHVHLGAFNQIQRTEIGATAVVNAYQFKRIRLTDDGVEVGYKLE